jgi:hypothetical protein
MVERRDSRQGREGLGLSGCKGGPREGVKSGGREHHDASFCS